jgi:hypothetical protein
MQRFSQGGKGVVARAVDGTDISGLESVENFGSCGVGGMDDEDGFEAGVDHLFTEL